MPSPTLCLYSSPASLRIVMVRITGGPPARRSASPLLRLLSFLFLSVIPAVQSLGAPNLVLGNPFDESSRTILRYLGNATVNRDALQLTPDSRTGAIPFLTNKSGRVIYSTAFKIWEDGHRQDTLANSSAAASGGRNATGSTGSQKVVISFSTSFDFNIYRPNQTASGEGLAFIITADRDTMPANSTGQYLGLTNEATDGNATNRLVAIEFDTAKQTPYDPDANHVGLDINGVRHSISRSLADVNITLSPLNESVIYRAWVDYNGTERHIYVYVAGKDNPKPRSPVLNASLDLGELLAKHSYFGFSGSTGTLYELNCILAWNLTAEILPEDGNTSTWVWVLRVGVPVLGLMLVSGVALAIYRHRKKVKRDERLVGTLKSLPGTPREFQYKELKTATGSFDVKNKLGEGGYGIVYRGVIPRENVEVAVKTFSRETMQGDFLAELTIINRLRHKHLVRLLGWCHKHGKLLLVYDYMPNGSLDRQLFHAQSGCHLPWDRRYHILTGVASALHYLHNEYDQKVVHRDLKASNVLLDSDFNARLGDFGLARAIDNERTSYAELELDGVPGTMGYIAPECFHTGKATRESDVFGFGTVVLEVVCGRRPQCDIAGFRFLVDWVWKLHREGSLLEAVDPRLGSDYATEDAQRLLMLGLACCHPCPGDRPKTQSIVQIISKSVPPPEVPPSRPAFVWPSAAATDDDGGSSGATTVTAATSSFYGSAGEWAQQYTSKDSEDISMA